MEAASAQPLHNVNLLMLQQAAVIGVLWSDEDQRAASAAGRSFRYEAVGVEDHSASPPKVVTIENGNNRLSSSPGNVSMLT